MKKGVSGDRNSGFFKKRNTIVRPTLSVHITEEEAALAQSNYNVQKITEIQNRFTGGETLLVPGRLFVREGPLWKVCRKDVKKRQFFLFNDILVYGSIVANHYSNLHILPLSKMVVSSRCEYMRDLSLQFSQEQLGEGLDMLNAFQVSHAEKSFHVVAMTPADKANWLSNLMKYIRKASSQEANVETRAIWVPDSLAKDCMSCGVRFSAFIRKHHCRKCGRVVCSGCSPHRLELCPRGSFSSSTEERVCSQCFQHGHASNGGPTLSVPPPHPASTATATPPHTTTAPPRADVDESTDTEDTDDSSEDEAPPLSNEAPPLANEAPPLANEAPPLTNEAPPLKNEAPPLKNETPPHTKECIEATSTKPAAVEERRPTPPPRRKRVKGQTEVAVGLEIVDKMEEQRPKHPEMGVASVAIGDVQITPDVQVPRPPMDQDDQTDAKELLRKHRRKKKYFGEQSLGGQEPSVGGQEPSIGGQEPSIGGQEPSVGGQEPSIGGHEPSVGGQEPSVGGQEPSVGGQEPSIGGQESNHKNTYDGEVFERSLSPTHNSSTSVQGTSSSRKSARRRQKFATDLVS